MNYAPITALISLAWCMLSLACDAQSPKSKPWAAVIATASTDQVIAKSIAASRFVDDHRGGGVVATAWRDAKKEQGLTFGAKLPSSARAPMDVGLATTDEAQSGGRGDFVVRVAHEAFADAPLVSNAGRASYEDVAPSTDLLVAVDDTKFEWFYLLRDAIAPTHFALHVELPKGIRQVTTMEDGSIAFNDARRTTRLAIPVAHAIDARGEHRDVQLAWHADDATHGRLDINVDTRGLTYPVLVDPALQHPIWQPVTTLGTTPPLRYGASMAYDSARNVTVLFGGGYTSAPIYLDDTWEWDGTSWTQVFPTLSPPARTYGSMTYDSIRKKTVLFGGSASGTQPGLSFDDTWEWDGTSWNQIAVTTSPQGRLYASMAYDIARGKSIMFGGLVGYNQPNDLWEWDGTTWTYVTPATGPSGREGATMVYDNARSKTVLFGGWNGGNSYFNDTWEWDGSAWAQRMVAAPPVGRAFAMMAYDSGRGQSVLVGGNDGSGYSADTWEWNGTTWAERVAYDATFGRAASTMVYDVARAKTVLFGGYADVFLAASNDTWEWDGTTWAQGMVATAPSSRSSAGMAFDSTRKKMVLFGGGGTTGDFGDTWEWDGTSWNERTDLTTAPLARGGQAMAYDSNRGQSVLFGGFDVHYTPLTDTWEYDGTMWRQRAVSVPPPANAGGPHSLTYDSARNVTVMFGTSGTWEWNGTSWTQRSTSPSPPASNSASLVYDSARAVSVLFGGASATNGGSNQTWEWNGTTWTQRMATPSPLGRYSASIAYDSVRQRSILFGGAEAGYSVNDTWEWDGTTWTNVSTASPSIRADAMMAFDSARGETVLFGGGENAGTLNDTWLYFVVGAACTTTSGCDLGFCNDGVCCNQATCGACQACNLAGSEGTCSDVPANTVPTTGDSNACASPKTCTAAGSCASAMGAACVVAADCVSGFCVDGVCCDSACGGDCQACGPVRGLATSGSCAFAPEGEFGRTSCANNFLCNGKSPSCATTCTDDATCGGGYYCANDGTCAPQKSEAATCNDSAGKDCLTSGCRECAQGHCVDGACCASCQGSASLGSTCNNDATCESNHCVGNLCCQSSCATTDAGGASVCQAGVCDPSLGYECRSAGGETPCREESCTDGTHTFLATCNGSGGCGAVESQSCSPYVCAGVACKTTCILNSDCVAGATCNTNTMRCEYGASCSPDKTKVLSNDGTSTPCTPYVCAGDKCGTSCATVLDCQAGYACATNGTCVPSSEATANPSSGCSCRSARTGNTGAPFGMAFAAIAFAGLRRRRVGIASSPVRERASRRTQRRGHAVRAV